MRNKSRYAKFAAGLWMLIATISCTSVQRADLVIENGRIYTMQEDLPWAEAVAIRDGRILHVGSRQSMKRFIGSHTTILNANGHFVMPGFIEGHGHFSSLGKSLQEINLLGTSSWRKVIEVVAKAAEESEPGTWITGRGWHQEKWLDTLIRNVHGYPFHDALSEVSPHNPVLLEHASGHALLANALAMQKAGVQRETPDPFGGHVVRDTDGMPIGVFEENAMAIIESSYQEFLTGLSEEELTQRWFAAVELATAECLQKGITSFQDAGASLVEIDRYRQLAKQGDLGVRLWVMIYQEYDFLKSRLDDFPIIGFGDHMFTCRAVKMYVDGALGSYGAWLLEPYRDKPGSRGLNTYDLDKVRSMAGLCSEHGLQFCVHAIGDRANREVLNIFSNVMSALPDTADLRWRIEHAQHLHPDDIPRFASTNTIASMQGIHCTSDAPFVVKRLGEQRASEGAYPWRALLDSGAIIVNGTDAPVEDVDPIPSFYASVTRKANPSGPAFFPQQAMTRQEALRSYTLAAAYGAFEEDIKGSLEAGKLADLVILSNDLISCDEDSIPNTRVLMTILGGVVRYQSEEW